MSITNDKLTTGKVGGDGTFDLLMSTMNEHLQEQFQKGHLTGPQYSEVYLGGLTSAMSQSIEFLLRLESTNKQNELLDEQIEQAKKQTEQLVAQTEQIQAQTLQIEKQIELTEKQIEQINKNIELVTRQISQMDVQDTQTEAQTALLGVQKEQAEGELLQQAKNLEISDQQLERGTKEIELIVKQIIGQEESNNKILSETALLEQKKITEEGQTTNVSAGVIGKQIELYSAQIQGFTDDAEHKKRQSDAQIFTVARGTNNSVKAPEWYRGPLF